MSRGTQDPLALPLAGLHLIEASAGTGKTYAIAHLVLRLVLETGLGLEQILVLTFTEAAAEELRDRVARRLRQARAVLSGEPTEDGLLAEWIADLPEPVLARARLDAALADLDQAAVYTIHGFCRRVLRDFAFESGAPFDAELIIDEQDLRRIAAQDFWRRRLGAADRGEAAWLLGEFPRGPEALLACLAGHLGAAAPEILGADPGRVRTGLERLRDLHKRLVDAWPQVRETVAELLRDSPALKRNAYSASALAEAISQMDALCASPLPADEPKRLDLFTPDKLRASTKAKATPPGHPFFDLCGELKALDLKALAQARRADLLADAVGFLRSELERRKRERRVLYFDDLLTHTAQALAGPRAEALSAKVRKAYPQALIDEFQDTDDLQYRIFSAIYGDRLKGDDGIGLYLIGDPKQAIYGFRGADIFTYIAARRRAERDGAIHSLDTNRRSASGLVEAVNRLFGRTQAPFIFDRDIAFDPVRPGPEADLTPLRIGGKKAPPLVFRWLPLTESNATKTGRRIIADEARAAAVTDCASQIRDLLAEPARLGYDPLRAGDIAVLVRSHRDGSAVRQALGGIGIASVSIGQETVFESEEAEDLAALLAALRPGAGDGALRAALATRSLGWTAGELAGLGTDEGAWEQVLADFEGYRTTWGARGFLAALEELLHGRGVPARLRRGPDGERRLTNLLHLAELAQAASREHPGPEGLERWLADRRSNPKDGGDAALLRLESDENLVQVVTYHKSKGLEYPVVFLPVPWSPGPRPDAKAPVSFHDRETLAARLDLGSPQHAAHRDLWAEEDLAERLRLFYVALTRAKQRCVVHWGAVNGAEGSAAAYLLHQGPDGTPAAERMKDLGEMDLRGELEALARSAPDCIRVEDLAAADAGPPSAPSAEPADLQAASFRGRVPDQWRLLSFSFLASGRDAERPDYDGLDTRGEAPPGGLETSTQAPVDAVETPDGLPDPIFRFPRGIQAGHCLHDLFEHLDFRAAAGPELQRAAETALTRHGIETHWTDTLVELAGRVLDTPLTPEGLRLRGVGPEDRRNELEFHFALDGFDPSALMRLLRDHGVPVAGGLPSERLAGLMKGFVDLVLRFEGRFYILDYKSNHLGDRLDDYDTEGLARAMAGHHYHLQYLIYTLALHRYLGLRLRGYDYERHMGGALYLFLRGMRPALGADRGVFRARPTLSLIRDLDRAFGGPEGRFE